MHSVNVGFMYITAARIMSTTLKIGIPGGLLVSQLEKKLKLLFSYRNI